MEEGVVDLHEHRPGNIEREGDFELGEVDAGLADSDFILEETFNCAEICQVQSEPHAAIAEFDVDVGSPMNNLYPLPPAPLSVAEVS